MLYPLSHVRTELTHIMDTIGLNWNSHKTNLYFAEMLLLAYAVFLGAIAVDGFSPSSNVHTLLLCRHGDR